MEIHFFAKTDVGKVRTANEDYFLNEKIADNEFLFVVADGMGGHQAGDVASKLASETFFDAYKSLRKKNTAIMESMETAIKKANAMVFKKAAADIEKRGMGTTFSAVIIAQMKAYIAHVGDSRIYLIRKNKIKKITTDHSFVEKLVEEGRISPEEARDHPQKNVLYMSLGARESFSPEILNEIALEDGDALLMCSDGLSNMVPDETLMEVTVGDYPEEAADILVKMANANGGTDNITMQIIRVGSLEMLEKTRPIRLGRSRKKMISAISVLLLLVIVVALWYVFKTIGHGEVKIEKSAGSAFLAGKPQPKELFKITEIDSSKLNDLGLVAADCRFLIDQQLHFVKNNMLVVLNLQNQSLKKIPLSNEDQVVPSANGEIYLLRKSATLAVEYRLLATNASKPLLIIQADKQFDLKEMASKRGKIFKIANLQENVIPDFIDESVFVFHDFRQYYGITNWQTADSQQFPIPGLVFSEGSQLFFKKIDGQMTMLCSNQRQGRFMIYSMSNFEKIEEYQLPPLFTSLYVEYFKDHSLLFYYPDQCIVIRRGEKEIRRQYLFNHYQFPIVKILLDMENGQKLFFNDSNKLFTLPCES